MEKFARTLLDGQSGGELTDNAVSVGANRKGQPIKRRARNFVFLPLARCASLGSCTLCFGVLRARGEAQGAKIKSKA